MSQTETLLLIVLGFALAALVALFAGRLLWSAAIRLGARRMQRQVPSTLVGLQTERDRLRAEFAMLSQRLGSRLEATKLRMAEQMAEVSRHRNRLEVAETQLADRDEKISGLTEQLASLTAQLATAESSRTALEASLAERQAELETARAQLADMVQRKSFHLPIIDTGRNDEEESNDRLRQRIGKLSQMAKSVAQERENPDAVEPATADPLVLEKLSEAERQTADLQEELEKLDAEWSKRLGELKDDARPAIANQPGAVANVISLANRIRALKKDIGSG